jgi:hypothetical protein
MTTMNTVKLLSIASLFGFAAVAACSMKTASGGDNVNADANEAAASSAQSTHMGNLVFSSVSSQDPATAAGQAASAAQLWPAGCLTRAKDPTNPNVVDLTFNDCTGPFGLVHINGEVIVTFSKDAASGALVAQHTGQNLSINGHPVSFSGTANITVSGTTRNVQWDGAWTRVDLAGDTVAHTSSLTIVVDTAAKCRTSNGSAQTTVGDREVDSTIQNYEICENPDGSEACPKSGTIIHDHKLTGRTVTVTFDGSNEATFTGPNGGTVKVEMVCGV